MCAYCVIVTGIRTWWAKKTDLLFEVCNFFTVTTWKSISVACYCVSVEGQNQSDQAVPGVLLPNQRRTTSHLKNQFRGSSILRLALSIRCALLLLNTVGVLISLWACMCICRLVVTHGKYDVRPTVIFPTMEHHRYLTSTKTEQNDCFAVFKKMLYHQLVKCVA